MTETKVDVAIVGAGPYGLSLGAHLLATGVDCRVFGQPMQTWRTAMPEGMHLKSDGFASNLSDPGATLTLARYCAEQNLPYADLGLPVPLETFVSYGLEFQRRFVPSLDDRSVTSLRRLPEGFALTLSDGDEITARRVVLAVGIVYFSYVPDVFRELPPELCSHSSQHAHLEEFAGREVAVVGAGASALDLAALLNQAGAKVELVARGHVTFHDRMRLPRRLHERILAPTSGVGPGWQSRFFTDAAPLFHRLPERRRITLVQNTLGPVGGWFIREGVIGKVHLNEGATVIRASDDGGRARLELRRADGTENELTCDHVIAATGYRIDLRRLDFLDPQLSSQIATAERTPVLSNYFESSVPNLYFVGATAANSFGPVLRFAFGSRFVARRLTRHLVRARNP